MTAMGKILEYKNGILTLAVGNIIRSLEQTQSRYVEVRIQDGREISADQRKKIFALIGDIARWSGYEKAFLRAFLTDEFCMERDKMPFSLVNVDMSTAKEFINYLIEFCLKHDVPCMDTLLNRTDDIYKYIYLCLEYNRCCISGKKAEFHHCTGHRVGMGRNREEIPLLGVNALPLSTEYHNEVHGMAEQDFIEKYHLEPVTVDEYLLTKIKTKGLRR